MASYQKRGKTWQFTISRVIDGKQRPIRKGGFKTKKEAMVAVTEIENRLNNRLPVQIAEKPFSDFFIEWVRVFRSNIQGSTKGTYKVTENAIQNYFGNKSIQSITRRDYQKFMNHLGKKLVRSTNQKTNSRIRACVLDAIDEGYITTDFTRAVVITGKRGKNPENKHLDYKDSKKLFDYLLENLTKSNIHYILLLALSAGLRFGEIVGLTKDSFDFKSNKLSINKTWGYTSETGIGFKPTKNEKSNRIIELNELVANVFKDFVHKVPDNEYNLVFYRPSSKYKTFSNEASNKRLRVILKQINAKSISVHGLRHTFVSVCLYKGVSINYVSEIVGHADIETTYKHYSHILKEMREKDKKIMRSIF